jgi:hypothetical protein
MTAPARRIIAVARSRRIFSKEEVCFQDGEKAKKWW